MHLANVPFYSDNLVLINHKNEPFVPMRPIVEQIGLAWQSQHAKIKDRFNSVVTNIVTTGNDGKRYEMVCMPLRKLPAWLYSISPNRVAPELKDKIILYQEECDDVLWQYWTTGFVGNQKPTASVTHSRHRIRLAKQLEQEKNPTIRAMIYEDLKIISAELGASVPELSEIGFDNPYADLLEHFWEFYETEKEKLNHSCNPKLIAIHITEALPLFENYMGERIGRRVFCVALENSHRPQYLKNGNIYSSHAKTAKRCLIFEAQ